MISREILDEEADQKRILMGTVVASLGLVLAGAGAGYTFADLSSESVSPQHAGKTVVGALQNSSGSQVSLVDVERRNGLYMVQLSSNDRLQTLYVTRDGRKYTTALNNLTEFVETASLQASTRRCLNSGNVTMYGNATQRATQLQIQLMGGARNVQGYYRDVSQPGVLQRAARQGVTRVPAFVRSGETLSGVNNITAVRSFAGCGR
ncbi:MAG: hypothetical protein ABEJ03_01750 [Candidatus Nanohaloarchaea archaeon]